VGRHGRHRRGRNGCGWDLRRAPRRRTRVHEVDARPVSATGRRRADAPREARRVTAAILRPLADVAQLVERLLAMQKVDGSSPFIRFTEPAGFVCAGGAPSTQESAMVSTRGCSGDQSDCGAAGARATRELARTLVFTDASISGILSPERSTRRRRLRRHLRHRRRPHLRHPSLRSTQRHRSRNSLVHQRLVESRHRKSTQPPLPSWRRRRCLTACDRRALECDRQYSSPELTSVVPLRMPNEVPTLPTESGPRELPSCVRHERSELAPGALQAHKPL
jgi:hypothetical protein